MGEAGVTEALEPGEFRRSRPVRPSCGAEGDVGLTRLCQEVLPFFALAAWASRILAFSRVLRRRLRRLISFFLSLIDMGSTPSPRCGSNFSGSGAPFPRL